jgi:hypothetical protein
VRGTSLTNYGFTVASSANNLMFFGAGAFNGGVPTISSATGRLFIYPTEGTLARYVDFSNTSVKFSQLLLEGEGNQNNINLYVGGNGALRLTTTNSTNSIEFFTNNINRASIVASTGNVLINTTTDAGYKLDVNGTVRTGNLTVGNMLIGDVGGTRVFNTAGLAIDYGTLYPFSITGTSTASITPAGILTLKGVTHNYTGAETYRVQKTTNIGHLQINFDIVGSDAAAYNYGTRSGNVRIYPGEQSNINGYGNVIIGHNGTSSIVNPSITKYTIGKLDSFLA